MSKGLGTHPHVRYRGGSIQDLAQITRPFLNPPNFEPDVDDPAKRITQMKEERHRRRVDKWKEEVETTGYRLGALSSPQYESGGNDPRHIRNDFDLVTAYASLVRGSGNRDPAKETHKNVYKQTNSLASRSKSVELRSRRNLRNDSPSHGRVPQSPGQRTTERAPPPPSLLLMHERLEAQVGALTDIIVREQQLRRAQGGDFSKIMESLESLRGQLSAVESRDRNPRNSHDSSDRLSTVTPLSAPSTPRSALRKTTAY
eukprot:TRINITY_DN40602_c0_g1_i1.p1 TRINITY_DN40602_c0_g1~~TRINITY_DN40602_c0_g1_i1.p1  ORF type:complete len:258 (-),score=23.04 TRINITY_DN40602_c0_g1_i1:10-783(-)